MKKIVISTLLATTLLLANNNLNSNQTNSISKIVESYEKLASQGEIEAMFNLGLKNSGFMTHITKNNTPTAINPNI
jgi:hypothetical protein